MNRAPLVTVIIPTYNWSEVLPFSIGSVLRQTFQDFELLVVGDGCTDNSEQVVKAQGDNRVRWINLPANTGHQSDPNNEGLRQARGLFIAYLGHDDLWFPHHLSALVAALNSGADMAFALTEIVGAEEKFKVAAPSNFKYSRGAWIPPTAVMHKRDQVTALGGWRHYWELDVDPEIDLWQRLYDAGNKIDFVSRLTAIKFSASERPGIYKERPCDEQKLWFHRIHGEPHLEANELPVLLANSFPTARDRFYTARLRLRRSLKEFFHRPPKQAKGAALEARRLIKGLQPKSYPDSSQSDQN